MYGDSRGFRTRRHREHVDGDYRNPPPVGKYAEKENRSRKSLKEPPVVLPPAWRKIIGNALIERLTKLDAYVLCVGVSGQHIHLLVKVSKGSSRHLLGKAKQHAWFEARKGGWIGRLWAKRGRAIPVRSKKHQGNAYQYILAHADEGAWIWVHPDVRKLKP